MSRVDIITGLKRLQDWMNECPFRELLARAIKLLEEDAKRPTADDVYAFLTAYAVGVSLRDKAEGDVIKLALAKAQQMVPEDIARRLLAASPGYAGGGFAPPSKEVS